uniref:Lunapark zinc ribbon domain-containing protein n=1 Tax=Oryza glumipatula TaxID=40148 RepID=A0A0D9ZSA8_9ORYZ
MAEGDAYAASAAASAASPRTPAPPETPSTQKRRQRGLVSRVWKGIFGRREDVEKLLQALSKEEEAVRSRLRRRARASRQSAHNVLAIAAALEIVAVGYAIMTTRSPDLSWQMRATRVLPMFLIPALAALIYSTITSVTKMLDNRDQHTLENLRAERQAKIDELKERTNYYTTQQLIQRYDLDPAAKAAAATVLASKLGADSGLRVFLGDESNRDATLSKSNDAQTTGPRQRKPGHLSNSTGRTYGPESLGGSYAYDGNEGVTTPNQRTVDHFRGPAGNDGGWLARAAALLVGEDPTQCYALICGNCHMHNGLARKEDFAFITYYCPHCNALNGSRQHDEHEMVSPGKETPISHSDGSIGHAGANLANSGAGSPIVKDLPTVEELPAESSVATNLPSAEELPAESPIANNLPAVEELAAESPVASSTPAIEELPAEGTVEKASIDHPAS